MAKKKTLRLAGTEATKPERTPAKRWSPALTKSWTPVSDYFLENYHRLEFPLTTSEAMLVIHLMRFKWDERMPFPGFKKLAKCMGKSTATVRKDARNLQSKKYLKRHIRVGTTNRFDFQPLFRALERLQAKDEAAKTKDEASGSSATAG